MKKQVKWALLLLCAAAAGASLYYSATAPLQVETVVLEPQRAEVSFTAQGVQTHARAFSLVPLVSGRIEQLYFAEGDTIEAGDVLMRIDAADYAHQIAQLESAQAGYEAQKAELQNQEEQRKQALRDSLAAMAGQIKSIRGQRYGNHYDGDNLESAIDSARLIVQNHQQALELREQELEEARAAHLANTADPAAEARYLLAQGQVNDAERAYTAGLKDLDMIQSGDVISDIYFEGLLQQAYAQEEAMRARLEEDYTGPMTAYYDALSAAADAQMAQLRTQAAHCSLTSPVGGVLTDLPAADSNMAAAGIPAAEVGIGSAVEVYVPLREISAVSAGQAVSLIFENTGGDITYGGTVSAVDERAEVQMTALGVEERRVKVTVGTDAPLGLGYAVDVKFISYEQADALVAPKAALFTDASGADCVFAVADGVIVRREVQKGMETREGFVIDGGLAAGDVLIKDAGADGVEEGRRVAA